MQYIDKSIRENEGKQIIDNLLSDCWNNEDNSYVEANYDTLCKHEYREPFVNLLLEEQSNLCCYCMRELANDHKTTLEHIIPHKASITDFAEYTSKLFINNIIHKDNFSNV